MTETNPNQAPPEINSQDFFETYFLNFLRVLGLISPEVDSKNHGNETKNNEQKLNLPDNLPQELREKILKIDHQIFEVWQTLNRILLKNKYGDLLLNEIELVGTKDKKGKVGELYFQIEEFLILARNLPEFVELEKEFCFYLVNDMKTIREIFDMSFSFNKNRARIGSFMPSIVNLINGEVENGEIYQYGLIQLWSKTREKILANNKI